MYTILRNYYKITALIDKHDVLRIIALTWSKLLNLDAQVYAKVSIIDFSEIEGLSFQDDIQSITELPDWIINLLSEHYSNEQIIDLSKSFQQQAPLDLRVNILKGDVDSVLAALTQENLSPQLMKFSRYGIRMLNKSFLVKHKLFIDGKIEIQDESSQLAGLLLNPKRGEMIVDFCAGSGGKTLLIGMLMRNTGRIYAFDVHEKRLGNLTPRLARSGLSNVHPQLIASENDTKIKRLHGKIDRVFVDAPCTGLGTLRRNPELKFRQNLQSLAEINEKQTSILNSASKLLKVGGYLVYATCSILFEENNAIVDKFLETHPDFSMVDASAALGIPELKRNDGYLVLLPNIHQTDGFFAALLQKTK